MPLFPRFSALKIDVRWQIRSIDMERHESWWVIMSHHESSWTYDIYIYICYFVCIIYNCISWYCTSRFSKALQVAPLGQPWARCARVLGLGTQAQQVQRPVNLVSKLRNKLEETASILEKWQVNDDDDDDDDLVEKSWQTNRLWLWWGEQLLAVLFNFPPWWCQPKPSSLTAGTEGELFKTRLSCNCSRNQEHLSRQETVLLRFGIFWCVWSIPDILSDTVLLSCRPLISFNRKKYINLH